MPWHIRLAFPFVPHDLGSVGIQPTWEINVLCEQPLIFQGQVPHFVFQGGRYYPVSIQEEIGSKDLLGLSNAIFCLLSSYKGFIFSSPERIRVYRDRVEELLAWIEEMGYTAAPALLKKVFASNYWFPFNSGCFW